MKLDEIKALCDAQKSGPWSVVKMRGPDAGSDHYLVTYEFDGVICHSFHGPDLARFIAAARTLMPKLVAVARAAKAGPCRHVNTADNRGCDLCTTLAALEAP